jgi:hypothetical protein
MKQAILILLACAFGFTNPLGDLAVSMTPGTWAQLPTNGFTYQEISYAGDAGANTFMWANKAAWDPATEQLFFIGKGHRYRLWKFVSYSAETNTWRKMPEAPRMDYANQAGHGYGNNTIVPEDGLFVHYRSGGSGSGRPYKFDIAAETWYAMPAIPNCGTECWAWGESFEYFPELNGFIKVMYDRIRFFNKATNTWSVLHSKVDMGSCSALAVYNPVHKVMLIGGGEDYNSTGNSVPNNKFYRLQSNGQLVPLESPPTHIHGSGAHAVDPVTGKYLIIDQSGNVYAFDIMENSWELLRSATPWGAGGHTNTVAVPVSNYGVIMVVYGPNYENGQVWLYKFADGQTGTVANAGHHQSMFKISASPNPFTSSTIISINSRFKIDDCRLKIYDINGKMIKDFTSKIKNQQSSILNQIIWNPASLPAGIYYVKATIGNRQISKKLFLVK